MCHATIRNQAPSSMVSTELHSRPPARAISNSISLGISTLARNESDNCSFRSVCLVLEVYISVSRRFQGSTHRSRNLAKITALDLLLDASVLLTIEVLLLTVPLFYLRWENRK